MKIRGGEGKYILKKAVEDLLPREHRLSQEDGIPHADAPMAAAIRRRRRSARTCSTRDGLLATYIDIGRAGRLLGQAQARR